MWQTLWGLGKGVSETLLGPPASPDDLLEDEPPVGAPEPVVPLEIDWSTVLKRIRHRELDDAAALMSLKEEWKKELENPDNGSTVRDKLESIFKSRIFKLSMARSHEEAAEFAILYNELGADPEPILIFLHKQTANFLQKEGTAYYQKVVASSRPDAQEHSNCVDAVGRFLVLTCKQIEHNAYIEQVFGVLKFLKFIKGLQDTVTSCSLKFFKFFWENRKLDIYTKQKGGVKTDDNKNSSDDDTITLAGLLDEIVLFISHVEVYKTFIRKHYEFGVSRLRVKGHTFEAPNPQSETSKQLHLPSYIGEPTELYDAIQQLVTAYLYLEPLFLSSSVKLIMKNEEESSSVVGDTFAICLRTLQRSLGIRNVMICSDTVKSLVSYFNGTLINTFKSRAIASLPAINSLFKADKKNQCSSINDIHQACQFTKKMKEDGKTIAKKIWKTGEELTLILEVFDLFDTTIAAFEEALNTVVKDLATRLVQPLLNCTRIFGRFDYQMGHDQFKESQINDPWASEFASDANVIFMGYQDLLSPEINNKLIETVIDMIQDDLVSKIAQKKFTQLGGLQFNEDIRKITNFISTLSTVSVRKRFWKLNEIKELLMLEKVADVMEIWGENAGENIKWRLTANEVKSFLKRRTDFPPGTIDRLKL